MFNNSRSAQRIFIVVAALLLVVGCAGIAPPPETPTPPGAPSRPVEPPPPNVNLQGFPLEYRQGYADGCASANGTERKDAARFKSDGQYRTGWQDGNALCKKR